VKAANGIIGINRAGSCLEQDVWVDLDECRQGTITRRFFVTGGTKDNYLRYAPGEVTSSWSEADGQNLSRLSRVAVVFTLYTVFRGEGIFSDLPGFNKILLIEKLIISK